MKRLIIIMCAVTALVFTQDAAGQYRLTGVDVEYTYIARGDYPLTVTDPYGLGITQTLVTIPGGAPFTKQPMRLTDAALSALGINLNVTLNADGTGSIAEGSYYPDVNTITDENGNCVTLQQVLPVTDEFTYTSNGSLGLTTGGYNVLGVPGISNTSGMGGLGLSGSLTFEDYPMIPSHPTLCDPDGNDCFPFTVGDLDESGTLEIYPDVNLLGIPEYIPGGAPLTGISGGLFKKAGLNDGGVAMESIYNGSDEDFPGYVNTAPDFLLNWHGVDGGSSGLGLGDDDTDEDGDGTWFDRDLGIPGATASFISAACGGGSQPVYGDLSSLYPDGCVTVDLAASGFLMDPSGSLATWGNFLTANAAFYQTCMGYAAQGAVDASTCAVFGADDSADEFDAACLSDYSPGNFAALMDCSGKLTMNFDIPCVPVIEAREVVAEFIEVGGDACGTGDMNSDGGLNVLDVVALVNIVLSGADADCTGDMNGDGGLNVLDVVALVNTVLSGGGRVNEATSAEFNVIGNEVTMTADGYVGAVEMTLLHGNDFALTLTDEALIADFITTGNTTKLMIVEPTGTNMFTAEGNFTIENVVAASNSDDYMHVSVNLPASYVISAAYPNPFNPTTQFSLELNNDAYVSVKVFNTMGQMVDVITNGQMASGTYNLTWDGTNAASGVYLIQTEVGSEISNQKIMLIK